MKRNDGIDISERLILLLNCVMLWAFIVFSQNLTVDVEYDAGDLQDFVDKAMVSKALKPIFREKEQAMIK